MVNVKDKINIRGLIRQLKRKGYVVYDKPYQLNIVGVRSDNTKPNKFDDLIYVFWKTNTGRWKGKAYPATTDPGTYYLGSRMGSKLGTAILKEGQYKDVYEIDKHNGKYLALCQRNGPVTVYRDYDRDAILDFNNGRETTGSNYGINIHKATYATSGHVRTGVGEWSAGCQVFQKVDDFNEFMKMAQKQKELYGNKFTYTLIDERAYVRAIKRRGVYLLIGLVTVASYVGIRTYRNKSIIPKAIKNAFKKGRK